MAAPPASVVSPFVAGSPTALRVGDVPKVSRRAAAINVHIAGSSPGAAGALPTTGLTSEVSRLDIATTIELAESCGAADVATVGCCATVAGALNPGAAYGPVTAEVRRAFLTTPGPSSVVVDKIVSARAGGESVLGDSVPGDGAASRVVLATRREREGFDRLPRWDGVDVCEVILSELDIVALGSVAGEGVCEAEFAGVNVALAGPDVEYEPVFGPPVLTTTPGSVAEVVPDDVDAVLDGEADDPVGGPVCADDADEVDVEPSLDVDELADVADVDAATLPDLLDVDESVDDELVDDDSGPGSPEGSAHAIACPSANAAPIPIATASPQIRPAECIVNV